MATERMPMRHVRDILRLKWVLKRSHREIARSLGVSAGAVGSVMVRAKAKGLSWEVVQDLDEAEIEERLYGPKKAPGEERPLPDPVWIHTELRRVGVTLELLHLEYLEVHPDGYRYAAFCRHYQRWLRRHHPSMRQVHKAGDKAFVDYSGKKPQLVDPTTGEVVEVELFVAVLGASNFTFAEATRTQRSIEFIQSHIRAAEYFGGVPALWVPDQLRSGVSSPCRYEPTLQRTYEDWARHYGTAVLPARQGKAKDKAKVEVAVQIAQRWILARLRNETFFSLEALNERIRELLEDLNDRPMRTYGGQSRRQLFERLDGPALRALPSERFLYGEWKTVRVNIDYHVEADKHFYSVPHALIDIRDKLDARLTAATVEIFHRGDRLCVHRRSTQRGAHSTIPEHMPKAHRAHLEWSPSRLIRWGSRIGPSTEALVTAILQSRPHPEQGYRSCLGLFRLEKRYGQERLEAACARALCVGARSYRHVDSILKHSLDRLPLPHDESVTQPTVHENLRGPDYYKGEQLCLQNPPWKN
jgi:transposase